MKMRNDSQLESLENYQTNSQPTVVNIPPPPVKPKE